MLAVSKMEPERFDEQEAALRMMFDRRQTKATYLKYILSLAFLRAEGGTLKAKKWQDLYCGGWKGNWERRVRRC